MFLKEFCDNPEMFVGGASRFDIKQGTLGELSILFYTLKTEQYNLGQSVKKMCNVLILLNQSLGRYVFFSVLDERAH